MDRQRGFSLAEVLVAAAIAFALGWLLLRLVGATLATSDRVAQRLSAASGADRLSERLTAQAGSSWSVFVPATDVNGASNADGHELDFVTEDASHRQYWRAYFFDLTAGNVVAYAYSPGATPVASEHFAGVTSMQADSHPVTALVDPSNALYDPLFAGATVSPVSVDFGWNPKATGGNHVVRVQIAGDGVTRTLVLSSATAPTHFTVVIQYTPAP